MVLQKLLDYKWQHLVDGKPLVHYSKIERRGWTKVMWDDAYDDLYGFIEAGIDWDTKADLARRLEGLENQPKKARQILFDINGTFEKFHNSDVFDINKWQGKTGKISKKRGLRAFIDKRESDIKKRIEENTISRYSGKSIIDLNENPIGVVNEWNEQKKRGLKYRKGEWLDQDIVSDIIEVEDEDKEFSELESDRKKLRDLEFPNFVGFVNDATTQDELRTIRNLLSKNKVLSSNQIRDLSLRAFTKENRIIREENEARLARGLRQKQPLKESTRLELIQPLLIKDRPRNRLNRFATVDQAEDLMRRGEISKEAFDEIKNTTISKIEELEREAEKPSESEINKGIEWGLITEKDASLIRRAGGANLLPTKTRERFRRIIIKDIVPIRLPRSRLRLEGFNERDIEEARDYWRDEVLKKGTKVRREIPADLRPNLVPRAVRDFITGMKEAKTDTDKKQITDSFEGTLRSFGYPKTNIENIKKSVLRR